MARKRVYISSTYEDLLPYRRTAAAIIDDCGHLAVDSYVAGPKPTVEQCLADVERCDVFAGIVGTRYGWTPADGDGRSITHREFDTSAGKPRLMFLTKGDTAGLAEPIANFRRLIPCSVLPVLFESLDDFAAVFRKTIRERLGIEEPLSPLLPFFCDRGSQYEKVDDRLWERRGNGDTRLRIFVVHGDALQSGAQFVEVLRCKLRSFPATRDMGEPLPFELEWPQVFGGAEAFRGRIRRALADQVLKNGHASIEEVERCLRGVAGPILIHTYVSTSEYERTGGSAIEEFCRFWEEGIELRRAHPLIVMLRIEYELPSASVLHRFWTPRVERTNESIRAFLRQRFSPREICEVLEELPRVSVNEAIRWSHDSEVRRHLRGTGWEARIRAIYETKFSREPGSSPRMDPLARELRALLKEGM
jgi:hypothetical protein